VRTLQGRLQDLGIVQVAAGGRHLVEGVQHIMIAVDLVEAAKVGDQERFAVEDVKWSRNVEEIAALLSTANPANWPQKDVLDLLNLHLSLTKGEVVVRPEQDWDMDVAAFDEILTEI
jgi:hypothetical protein